MSILSIDRAPGLNSRPRWRPVMVLLALALVAAACGDDAADSEAVVSDSASATDSAEPEPADDPDTEPTPEEEELPSPEPTEAAEAQESVVAVPEPDPEFRTIEHAFGTTEVPLKPERIFTTSISHALHLLSVGITPVGLPTGFGLLAVGMEGTDIAALIEEATSDAPVQGQGALEINPESVASLEPDLIVLDGIVATDSYELLSGIAPTVVIDRPNNGAWKAEFEQTVVAAGADQAAIDSVTNRYEALLAQISEGAGDTEIAFMRGANGGEQFRLEVGASFPGSVAAEMGFGLDDGGVTDIPDNGQILFSPELLSVIDADVLVTVQLPGGSFSSIDVFKDSPLWDQIPAVQNDAVIEVPFFIYQGGSYLAAEALVDVLIDATS